MARPRTYGDRIVTAVRLPPAVHRRLKEAARQRDVSVNLLVNRAVDDYLERLPPIESVLSDRGPES